MSERMRPVVKKKSALATKKVTKRNFTRRWQIWTTAVAIVLLILIVGLISSPPQKKTPSAAPTQGARNVDVLERRLSASIDTSTTTTQGKWPAVIQRVQLQPVRATRMDTLKAVVEPTPIAPEKIVYSFLWKVNDRIIEDATGDTLNLSSFHKRDLVTVTVTPYDGKTAGFAVESPVVAIHSAPPSLELQAVRQVRKTGEPIEMQLTGNAPDGNRVTFNLEPPNVPGMTIDRDSGKISWHLQSNQKGLLRFGASVEDDNGTKITKIFEITAD